MSLFRRKKKSTSKPPPSSQPPSLSSPSIHIEVMSDHVGEGDVSSPSSPQPAEVVYDLTYNKKWVEASVRCRTHPQDARWKTDNGWLPIHWACARGAPLSLIRQIHEAYREGVRTTDSSGSLPLHSACQGGASLEVIKYLVEAYGEGVKTTDKYGGLPLHNACNNGASLEVIEYLHGKYPDGATMKDRLYGEAPADQLKYNKKLSKEDKTKARAILSSPRPARTSPPRPQSMNHTPAQEAATTTMSADVPNTTTTSATTSTSTTNTSSDGPHSHGHPSSPTSNLHGGGAVDAAVIHGGGIAQGNDDLESAMNAMNVAVAARSMAGSEASRLEDEITEAESASKRADAILEEARTSEGEAMTAVQEIEAALSAARKRLEEASGRRAAAGTEADEARRRVTQLRREAEVARANVKKTSEAVDVAVAKVHDVKYKVFAPDRDRLKPFLESATGHASPVAAVGLCLGYVRGCTHDFSDDHRLGEGAFGVVYRGYDDVLQRRFAVKRIKYEIRTVRDEDEVRATRMMLENELKVLNEFKHAHIARLYGYILTENLKDEQILVYELASRGSLDSFFTNETKRSELSWQRRVLIALQVASALKFLHEGGGNEEHICYHRDVKSANICLRADYSAILIDCGLAKMIPKEDDSKAHGWSSSRRSAGQPGTIEYMCPLHASGVPASDRTDVFAFGIVLLELLNGEMQRRRPRGFYDKYVSTSAGGPGNASLLVHDVDRAAGTWKRDAREKYSDLALECIVTVPNDRPTMREIFRRLGDVAQAHCFLDPKEVEEILGGRQASSYERVLDIVEEVRAMQEEAMAKQDETMAKQDKTIATQEEANTKLTSIGRDVRGANVKIDSVLQRMQWMTAALTSVVREESCKCPRLAIMVPSGACDRISLRSPSTWVSKDVHLYFLCACDLTPVQHPVVLSVTRDWLKKAMPFLKIGMFVLRAASVAGRASTGLPFDILPGLAGEGLNHLDTGYLSIMGTQWTVELESYCESLVSAGGSGCTEAAAMSGKALTDEAYEVVAEKACEENNKSWSREMELVESGRDGLVWIKRENKTRWIQRIEKS